MDDRFAPARLPSHTQAELAIERARLMAGLAPTPAGTGEVHLHYHAQAPVAPEPQRTVAEDPGWALLHRLVPWFVLAGFLMIIITGCAVVLVWALGMLTALIHSLFALIIAGTVALGALGLLAGVLRPLFTGPSITITGSRNKVGQTRK